MIEEDLGLILHAPESGAMDDPVPVPFKSETVLVFLFRELPSLRKGVKGSEEGEFILFLTFPFDPEHCASPGTCRKS